MIVTASFNDASIVFLTAPFVGALVGAGLHCLAFANVDEVTNKTR